MCFPRENLGVQKFPLWGPLAPLEPPRTRFYQLFDPKCSRGALGTKMRKTAEMRILAQNKTCTPGHFGPKNRFLEGAIFSHLALETAEKTHFEFWEV